MFEWVSGDCHQSSVRCPGKAVMILAPKLRIHLALYHSPAPDPPLGAQFLCSNLSSLLRASLSLLFFVQSQLGARIPPGYRGQCIDHVRKWRWHWLWSIVPRSGNHVHVTKVAWLSPNKLITHSCQARRVSLVKYTVDIFLATKLTSWVDNFWVSLIPTKGIWGGEIF